MLHSISVLALLLTANAWSASDAKEQNGLLIKTKLTYESSGGAINTSKELILPLSNKGWAPLTAPANGVVLLGRMIKNDTTTIHMEYMLVDTRHDSSIISTPAIVARLGEEAKIAIDGNKISISLLAEKTPFHSKQ